MTIRIGSSCALSVNMSLGYAVETRILTDNSAKWQEVCKYAIDHKQYLILTPCINDGFNKPNIPTDNNWKTIIVNACKYLKSIGGNYSNCKISIINEPTKWFRDNGGKERYAHFINMAYPIVKSYGFRMGAGNMEFRDAAILGNWYGYICINSQFDDLDIHIQGSCDNEERTKNYTDFASGLATQYKKKLDCTEAFYGDITTSSGWSLLQTQLKHAERIGCANFCNVFNNIDTSVFPILSNPDVAKKWYKLCFKINGTINSNYWGHWKILMDTKHPVPNIIENIKEDDMELENFYYRNRPAYLIKRDPKGYGIAFLRKCFELSHSFIYDLALENKVKEYQSINGLLVDGKVGKETFGNMILKEDYYKFYCWTHSLWARDI